jgi:hypothetical protein
MSEQLNARVAAAAHEASVRTILEFILGYPAAAIQHGFRGAGGVEVDYAILDVRTRQLIAVIEVKLIDSETAQGQRRVHDTLSLLAGRFPSIPAFIAAAAAGGELRYFTLGKDGNVRKIPALPSYESLEKPSPEVRKAKVVAEERDVREKLRFKCYILAEIAAALFLYGIVGIWSPTFELLALAAAFGLLLILPDVQYLKVLGIELGMPMSLPAAVNKSSSAQDNSAAT